MAGRHAKPLKLLTGHFTKKEKAERKAAEIRFGDKTLTAPAFVRRDAAARAKWSELTALYADTRVDFISSADVGHMARYCKLYSEYLDLVTHRERVDKMQPFSSEEEKAATDEFEDRRGKRGAAKMWQKIEYILSVDGVLSIDAAINKKAAILTAMEDRLFLNPLAKIKTVPKGKDKPQADPLAKEGFGNV